MRISPEVGSIRRLIIFRAVVLPQPEGPMSTHTSPAGTVSESSYTAARPPLSYVFVTSRSSRTPARLALGTAAGAPLWSARPWRAQG